MAEQTEPGEKPSPIEPAQSATGIRSAPSPEAVPSVEAPSVAASSVVTPSVVTPAPQAVRRRSFAARQLDRVLIVLLLALTFFLGSFAARNADFVMSLATGRLIANGEYQFGVDPFAYTTDGVLWVNHSWLFDWSAYSLYSVAGHAGPILFKSFILMALALVLVAIHRREQTVWAPVICVGLAMIVMSPRFLMQSSCVSFLFLGITIYLLLTGRRLWLLPPLFALWVNFDNWFILGPLTVFLYLLGSLAQRLSGQQAPGQKPATLALVLVIGLAACLLNPHHYRAFILPAELATRLAPAGDVPPSSILAAGKTVRILEGDRGFAVFWSSPLSQTWRAPLGPGFNIAGLSYFLLLPLCLGSFVLPAVRDLRAFPWQRFLPWLFFAVLSLTQVRIIPFFAIISAPLLILNLQDFYAERVVPRASASVRRHRVLGRLATAVAFLGLIFLAWPGWLHGRIYPFDFHAPRRFALTVDFDPSLRGAAERLGELKSKALLKNVFAGSQELTCYCAWFAPQVKGFMDFRYSLFPNVTNEFLSTKKSLAGHAQEVLEGKARPGSGLEPWDKLVKDRGINCLALTGYMRGSQSTRLIGFLCWHDEPHWSWLYGDGRSELFGWNDPPGAAPFAGETVSLEREAFGIVPDGERAPPNGVILPEGEPSFWEGYLHESGRVPLPLETAEQYQFIPKILADRGRAAYVRVVQSGILNAALALNVAVPAGAAMPALTYHLPQQVYPSPSAAPAPALLLMRSARRAAVESPLNAQVYSMLAQAAENLWQLEKRWVPTPFQSVRHNMRQIQVIAARKAHLNLDPDDPRTHFTLAQMYLQLHYLDVAAEHLGQAARTWLRQPLAPVPDAGQQLLREREQIEKDYRNLEAEVKKRQDEFVLAAVRLSALERFSLALGQRPYRRSNGSEREQVDPQGFGLARKAQEAFDKAKLGQLSEQEKIILLTGQLSLLLRLGEIGAVNERVTQSPGFFQYRLYCAVARGDYAQADRDLKEQIGFLSIDTRVPRLVPMLLYSLAPSLGIPDLAKSALWFQHRQNEAGGLLQPGADFHFLRGLLLLERGDTEAALRQFEDSLRLAGNTIFLADKPIAERYVEALRRERRKAAR